MLVTFGIAEGRMVADMKDMIGTLQALYMDALVDASENFDAGVQKNTTADSGGVKYSFKGYADDGKGIYESNFPKGTPKKAKGERILEYIQNVWSKKPITLRIEQNGTVRYIEAQFDPTFSEDKNVRTDASKLMGGNRHGNAVEQRVTLDLADDYYQIAEEAQYNYSKDETGKNSETHKDVKVWHYFVNDIYFAEQGSDELIPFTVSINVKEKENGNFFYSFSAEKTEGTPTRRTLHADVNDGDNAIANGSSSNASIRNPNEIVNKKFSNRDSVGNQLSEEQQEYFKDSAVRDNDGNLLVLYHQTDGGFTIFDTRHPGAGTRDGGTPFGIFMKRSAGDIGLAGKKQMALYANITNPLRATNREDLTRKLCEISERYASISDQHKKLDAEYREKFEQAKKAWVNYIAEWRSANPGASRNALNADPKFNELFDAEDNVVDEWTAAADRLSIQAKEVITEDLRKAGYDGVFLAEDVGSWGRKTDAIIALDPEQVKNITNKKPTKNPDIRYSQRDTAAVEEFGTTSSFDQAGFAMADGRMLKLSQYGQTGVQHNRIEVVYDDVNGSEAVNRFIQEGNVRIKASSPGIEIGSEVAPTVSQLNTVSRFIANSLRKDGVFYLDITGKDGRSIASVTYDEDSDATDVLYDIKAYYDRGRVPHTRRYLYSGRDRSGKNQKPPLRRVVG